MCCALSDSIKSLKVLILKNSQHFTSMQFFGEVIPFLCSGIRECWLAHSSFIHFRSVLISMQNTLEVAWDSDNHLPFYILVGDVNNGTCKIMLTGQVSPSLTVKWFVLKIICIALFYKLSRKSEFYLLQKPHTMQLKSKIVKSSIKTAWLKMKLYSKVSV